MIEEKRFNVEEHPTLDGRVIYVFTISHRYIHDLEQQVKKLQEENAELDNKVIIMEKYFELITDLGYDYDGFTQGKDLKGLIDQLVHFANLGRVCNITEPIYVNGVKKYNILFEETNES